MEKFLFFDDRYFNVMSHVKRVMHSPRLLSKKPYIDPATELVNLAWGYPFVYFNESIQKYVMFYQGWSVRRDVIANTLSLCACSTDGKTFEPIDTAPYFSDADKRLPNQVLPYQLEGYTFAEGQFFRFDQLPGKNKFLALCIYKGNNNVFKAMTFVSEDGLRFLYHPEMSWHRGLNAPDYPISIVFDSKTSSFILYHRPSHTDRRIAMTRTTDFIHYSPLETILQSDALDIPLTDFYGINVLDYPPFFLGFLMLYHTPNFLRKGTFRVSGLPGHKFDGGNVEAQLVYSADGSHFSRFLRKSFFQKRTPEFACLYPTCVVAQNDRLVIYASATTEEHGRVTPGKGCIVSYQLRKDGFCSLSTQATEGELVTRQFLYTGGEIAFNLDASRGKIQIQIADSDNVPIPGFEYHQCEVFKGNSMSHVFTFNGNTLESLKSRVLVINIRSTNARLFSMTGNLHLMTAYEAMKYEGR